MIYERKLLIAENELQQYLGVSATFDFEDFEKKLEWTQNTLIVDCIGQKQLDRLLDGLVNDTLEETEKQLIHWLRYPLTAFAFVDFIPELMVEVDSSGIRIISNETYKSAFQWQVDKLEKSVQRAGHAQYENVLYFLDGHIDDFPLYHYSEAFENNHRCFMNTVREFDQYRNIRSLRDIFLAMGYIIDDVENQTILPTLGKPLFDALKGFVKTRLPGAQELSDGLLQLDEGDGGYYYGHLPEWNDHYTDLFRMIRFVIANLAFARAVPELNLIFDEKGFLSFNTVTNSNQVNAFNTIAQIKENNLAASAKTMGEKYLADLKKYLLQYADEIPLFKNSDAYQPDSGQPLRNKKEWGFHAGM